MAQIFNVLITRWLGETFDCCTIYWSIKKKGFMARRKYLGVFVMLLFASSSRLQKRLSSSCVTVNSVIQPELCVFNLMYSEELTIGSQEWINKSDWSVFLCWLVLAVRVKKRSWSVLRPLTDTCASKHSLIFCLWWIVNDSHGMRWRNCTANWRHLEFYDNSLRTRLTFGWSWNIDTFFATF